MDIDLRGITSISSSSMGLLARQGKSEDHERYTIHGQTGKSERIQAEGILQIVVPPSFFIFSLPRRRPTEELHLT